MTCAIGLVGESGVWLGSDRMISAGSFRSPNPAKKIIKKNVGKDIYMVFGGDLALSQFVQFKFAPPRIGHLSLDNYVFSRFIPQLADEIKSLSGVGDQNIEKLFNSVAFLLTDGSTLVEAYMSGSVEHVTRDSSVPFSAIGSGAAYALGALMAMWRFLEEESFYSRVRDIMELAIDSASRFEATCGHGSDIVFVYRS